MNLDDETPEIIDGAVDEGGGEDVGQSADSETASDEGPAFTFEGEEEADDTVDEASAPEWVRNVRKEARDTARENRELKRRIEEIEARSTSTVEALPDKPTLESCGYDEDQFEQELTAWHGKKSAVEARRTENQAKQAKVQEEWAAQVTSFEERAKTLVPNYAEQAAALAEKFGNDLNGNAAKAALIFADDPRLIAALNSSPAKLNELLALKDKPLALAVALGELKGKIRTMPRRTAPPPETVTKGGAPIAASVDQQLARLEKEADRTGDRSEVLKYKRQLREKAA